MIGEGWHIIMWINVYSTTLSSTIYFSIYILIVTIIVSNVFVGLFLAEIDELKKKQSEDETLTKFNKSSNFNYYAKNKLNLLKYKLKQLKLYEKKLNKQIFKIENLLVTKKIQKQNKLDMIERVRTSWIPE